MAIGFLIEVPGGTREKYDQTMIELNVAQQPISGLLFHTAGPIDGGWRVIDIWESEAAFEAFLHSRLQPALAKVEMPQPRIERIEVHNTYRPVA